MTLHNAIQELIKTTHILESDLNAARGLDGQNLTPFLARSAVRAFSAFIEGVLFQMRQIALHSDFSLTAEEVFLLEEKKPFLNEKGEAKRIDASGSLANTMLFTLRVFSKVHGISHSVNTADHGWESMKRFIDLRNKITHPKSSRDLTISAQEWDTFNSALDWFKAQIETIFQQCNAAEFAKR
jgi:hypothetical protein